MYRKWGSAWPRRNVTVPAESLAWIPADRSHDLGVPVAGRCAEDAFVVDGIGAEAELALDAAAEIGRPHGRAVGVTDSRAEREGVGRPAVGRPGQRNGQVRHERVPLRAACFAQAR